MFQGGGLGFRSAIKFRVLRVGRFITWKGAWRDDVGSDATGPKFAARDFVRPHTACFATATDDAPDNGKAFMPEKL